MLGFRGLNIHLKFCGNFSRNIFRIKRGLCATSVGILSEEETVSFIQMTDDRNLTSHTYDEGVADLLFGKVRGYYQLMRELLLRIKRGIGEV